MPLIDPSTLTVYHDAKLPRRSGLSSTSSPTSAAGIPPEATPGPRNTMQPRPPPQAGEMATASSTDSSSDDFGNYGVASVVASSVVGVSLLVVLVLTCVGLRSHCAAKGKSIRRSLAELVAKGSFWGAILVVFGLMVALNAYAVSMLWTIVSVFGTFVMCFGIVAWFVAFQTGTPAVVSLELPRRSAPASERGDSGERSGSGGVSGGSSRSVTSNSTCDTPRGCSFAASPSATELPTWFNGKSSGQSTVTAAAGPSASPARSAADSFFPDTFVRAVYIPAHSVDGLQP